MTSATSEVKFMKMENLLRIVYHHHLVIRHVFAQNMVEKQNLRVLFWIVPNGLEYQPNPDLLLMIIRNVWSMVLNIKKVNGFIPKIHVCIAFAKKDSKENMKNHFVKDRVVEYNLGDVQEQMFKVDDVCKFGDKTLKVGQRFEKINVETSFGQKIEKITCECLKIVTNLELCFMKIWIVLQFIIPNHVRSNINVKIGNKWTLINVIIIEKAMIIKKYFQIQVILVIIIVFAINITITPFENLATCVFNNEKYHEGQRFNLQDSCHDCICQKGFTNKIEKPFCKRRACSIQLQWSFIDKIQKYCAPFYGKVSENDALCCPLDWIC
ncbi:hypothetical protein BDFB_009390, partial [Asbolus verrucosus]